MKHNCLPRKITLAEPVIPAVFDNLDLEHVINHIIDVHHSFARERSKDIFDLTRELSFKHAEQVPALTKLNNACFLFFHDLNNHMFKEETSLFPNILQVIRNNTKNDKLRYSTFGLIRESISYMESAHHSCYEGLSLFRQITGDYTIPYGNVDCDYLYQIMKEFETDLLCHIRLEHEILFPRAIEIDESTTKAKPFTKPILKLKHNR